MFLATVRSRFFFFFAFSFFSLFSLFFLFSCLFSPPSSLSTPGTAKDTDFYFCQTSQDNLGNILPPKAFQVLQTGTSYEPGPAVFCRKPSDEDITEILRTVPIGLPYSQNNGNNGIHQNNQNMSNQSTQLHSVAQEIEENMSEEKSEYVQAQYGQLPKSYFGQFSRYTQDHGQDTSTDMSLTSNDDNNNDDNNNDDNDEHEIDNREDSLDIDADDSFEFSRMQGPGSAQGQADYANRSQGLNTLTLDLDRHLGILRLSVPLSLHLCPSVPLPLVFLCPLPLLSLLRQCCGALPPLLYTTFRKVSLHSSKKKPPLPLFPLSFLPSYPSLNSRSILLSLSSPSQSHISPSPPIACPPPLLLVPPPNLNLPHPGPEDDLDNDRQPQDLDSSSDEGSMVRAALAIHASSAVLCLNV